MQGSQFTNNVKIYVRPESNNQNSTLIQSSLDDLTRTCLDYTTDYWTISSHMSPALNKEVHMKENMDSLKLGHSSKQAAGKPMSMSMVSPAIVMWRLHLQLS